MSQHDRYISPFSTRYSSDEMQYIFSDDNKFRTWRRLWVALARAEMEQGLTNITPDMVAELEAHVDDINYEVAIEREKLVRHDVMSHVYAYGQQCPKAAGIIHLGATSCYVGDNTDIIVMRQGLELVRKKLIGVLAKLGRFAEEYKDMPCMAYTHCQPAQPTTVGKRATLWANELVMDLQEIDHRLAVLQLRGVKGTTGTQASFMELFKGDADKIRAVDASIAKEMGFDPKAVIPVSGQTYSRKVDAFILNALAGIGQSCMKFATDLRLLANFKEMEEPFEKNQIGSSAMPYKRNPMRCERICALARYLMVDVLNPKVIRSTAGSLFHLPVLAMSTDEFFTWTGDHNMDVWAADVYGTEERKPESLPAVLADKAAVEAPKAVLFGNEARGLEPDILTRCGRIVSIPLYGKAESLNLGTSAAVMLMSLSMSGHVERM
jgi:adenylosuccinate lyase